jgi:hypothetical protein
VRHDRDAAAVSDVPRIAGVRLDQYAGICAALVEGFALADVLANDALDRKIWLRAAPAWAAKLARETPEGPIYKMYTRKLAEATAWLGRRVTPLEHDIEPWMSFLGAWSRDPEPSTFLQRLGLRTADPARIQSLWAQRMEVDRGLRERMIEIAARRPTARPPIQVTPAVLRPFPWSARAALSSEPGHVAVDAPPGPPVAGPLVQMAKPSFLLEREQQRVARLPFLVDAGAPPAPTAAPPAATAPRFGETLDVFDLPRGPAIPFTSAPVPKGETVAALVLPRAAPLPFSPAPERRPEMPPIQKDGAEKGASSRFGDTLDAFELPAGRTLPFKAPPDASASKKKAPVPEAPAPPAIGETMPAFELPADFVLPFARPRAPAKPAEAAAAAPSTAPARTAMGAPDPPAAKEPDWPQLTLEQHASLAAELAAFPAHAADVLRRYRVTPEIKRSLDGRYHELATANPEIRAAWSRAYETYSRWLLSRSKRGR